MNPFSVPFATTNMGSAMLAMDLVSYNLKEDEILKHTLIVWVIKIDPFNFCLTYVTAGMDGAKLFNFHCLCYRQLLYIECSKPHH